MRTFFVAIAFCLMPLVNQSQSKPLINTPSLNPDGTQLAFSYQGDIWTVATNGQNLKRLTIHEGNDSNPYWSKDGNTIAFESSRFGNPDIFTIPTIGGIPNRITYHSSRDIITDFTANNDIIFNTYRNFVQVEREPEINIINAKGGTPARFLNALGFDAKQSPNGKLIVFTRGSCRIEREAYKGPADRDVWLYDITNDSYKQLTTFNGQDFNPQWQGNSTVYFQSARSGVYNVHRLNIDASGNKIGEVEQVSFLKDFGLFTFNLSANGEKIVMLSGDNVWLLSTNSKEIIPIDISINSDYRFDPYKRMSYTDNASQVKVSPNGKLRATIIRGEVFITQNDSKKSKTVNVSNSPYRDIDPLWLNDSTLVFISDREGVNNLYAVRSDDAKNTDIFKSLKHNVSKLTSSKVGITKPVLSPDKKLVAYNEGNANLVIASISETGKIANPKTIVNHWLAITDVSWSPDSKWISYSKQDLNFNRDVFIHKIDGSVKSINISMHPKSDSNPIWSNDGSKIVFSSNRNNSDHDVWFVWLRKKGWDKTKEDWDEDMDSSEDEDDKDDKEPDTDVVKDIIIDLDNIHERQQQVTSYTGGEYVRAISDDGETIYFVTGPSGRGNAKSERDLYSIKWNGEEKKEITKENTNPTHVSLVDDDFIYYISKGKSYRIKLSGNKKEGLPFSAKMVVDYKEEFNQIFEEAWKVINDKFYDPNHHGKNWDELKKIYKPLALKASTKADFKGVFNRMLGQINASHMGLYRGEQREETQKEKVGILGVSLKITSNNKLRVEQVIPNTAADRENSKLQVGDVILSVNGNLVSASENIYKYLIATSNERILLELERNNKVIEIVIRPKSSISDDNYKAWVNERKRLTDIYSEGRLGYIHIRGMNWKSFEHFERELMAAGNGKEGVVIDVRYNGGGWTTDYLMAVLNVKQHAYTIPRGAANNLDKDHNKFTNYYPFSERLPLASWTKPSVALCNQNSYSNAEIFSHAYKELGIGKLVGIPTFGAVISTGGHTLIDGSYVRVPYRGWFVKSSQKNMDFTPAVPDIIIHNAPDEKVKGIDAQLKRAVEELLKDL